MSEEEKEEKVETPQPEPLTLKWRRTRIDRPDDPSPWKRTSYIAVVSEGIAVSLTSDAYGWNAVLRTKPEVRPTGYLKAQPVGYDGEHEYPVVLVEGNIKAVLDETMFFERAKLITKSLLQKHYVRSQWGLKHREQALQKERATLELIANLAAQLPQPPPTEQ